MAKTRSGPPSAGQTLQELHGWLLGLAGIVLLLLHLLSWWQRLTAAR